MGDSFFTDAELENLRRISMEEIGELIEEIKAQSVAGSKKWLADAHALFHTIVGSAGVAGLNEISELAAEAESLSDPEHEAPDKSALNRIHKIAGRIENLLDN
jgi:HPt (histidine-containing phosphotransfer) domain-containing protein